MSSGPCFRYATRDGLHDHLCLLFHSQDADVPTILSLVRELATYENAASLVKATEASLAATLSFAVDDLAAPAFTPGYAKVLLALSPTREPVGFALFFTSYSTWRGQPGIYLEDLFVRPAFRGQRYGYQLIQRLAQEVVRIGGARLEWSCLDWNESSLQFYERLGAQRKSEWIGLRVDGEALAQLAALSG